MVDETEVGAMAVPAPWWRRPRAWAEAALILVLAAALVAVVFAACAGDGKSADVVFPCGEGLDRPFPGCLRMCLFKEAIGGEIIDRDRDHEPFDSRCVAALAHPSTSLGVTLSVSKGQHRPTVESGRAVVFTRQDVVCQECFLDISACAEQPAGRSERRVDFADDSRRAQDCELRSERGEQVAAMTLSSVIGMDRDPVDERAARPLGTDQDGDRIRTGEGHNAAAAPDLQIADRTFERRRRHRRLVRKPGTPAAIQRIDEKRDVIGPAKTIRRHSQSRGFAPICCFVRSAR